MYNYKFLTNKEQLDKSYQNWRLDCSDQFDVIYRSTFKKKYR